MPSTQSDLSVVIVGAGPAGLAASLALARRGRRVTLVERDPDQPLDDPAAAFARWQRPGVAHHHMPHSLLGRTRRALREHAPDVLAAMLRAGAWENDFGSRLVRDAAEPGDEDLVAVHCRRPFFECVLRRSQLLDLPDDLMRRDDIVQRVIALQPDLPTPPAGFAPTKDELLEIVARHAPAPR